MLRQRVVTALLLLAVLLPAVFYPMPQVFGWVSMVLIVAGAWEWARLNLLGTGQALATGGVCAVACCLWMVRVPDMSAASGIWLVLAAVWVLGGSWLLLRGAPHWVALPKAFRWLIGLTCLFGAWLAVVQARVIGINFLFSVMTLVWMADIGAYFAGRAFGGKFFSRKLAPTISPGKTWEGVLGGLVAVFVCAGLWMQVEHLMQPDSSSIYALVWQRGWWMAALSLLWLAAWSVVGDLVESLIKRSVGVKDSSQLLPGHGGVLDRLDALLPVLPMALMLRSFVV